MLKKNLTKKLGFIGIPMIALVFYFCKHGNLDEFTLLKYLIIIVIGYVAAYKDIKTHKVSNRLILSLLFSWIFIVSVNMFFNIDQTIKIIMDALFGFIVGGGVFLTVYLLSKKGIGGGDVKLMAVIGLFLGTANILTATLYGAVLSSLVSLILILLKKITLKDPVPFVPFLYIGILLIIF